MTTVIQSVALVLSNDEGRIYGVRELLSNPLYGKKAGNRSFPWETQEPGECDCCTLLRLLEEEVDATKQIEITLPLPIGTFDVRGTVARAYAARVLSAPAVLRGLHAGEEIEPIGFIPADCLMRNAREGVTDILAGHAQWMTWKARGGFSSLRPGLGSRSAGMHP